jgi:hypothetical protein
MKFRGTKNSIRLRLRRSEVEALYLEGQVTESISFGVGQQFSVVLKTDVEASTVRAELLNRSIVVRLPKQQADSWRESENIGIEGRQDDGAGGKLLILIEKDISCKGRDEENKSDFFEELSEKDC